MAKGKRAGARPKRRLRRDVLLPLIGTILAVIAWGYLVWAAIHFGTAARGGDSHAWAFLALAAVGAMACLFVGLLLAGRVLHVLTTRTSIVLRNELTPPVGAPTPGQTGQTPLAHRHRAD